MKTLLTITGTHCVSCKVLLEEVCRDVAGIRSCTVDYDTGKIEVEHDQTVDWPTLKNEIESLGQYKVDLGQVQPVFVCPECGMKYAEQSWAEKCEAWCKEHHSCNLEIIQHATP